MGRIGGPRLGAPTPPPPFTLLHRWKAAQDGAPAPEPSPATADGAAASVDAAAAGVAALAVGDGAAAPPAAADAAAAAAPPPKEKKPSKKKGAPKEPAVVMEVTTRGKRKSVTVVAGLDAFGVKLAEASKLMGKKFASGASVTKTAEGGEQIEVQGDVAVRAGELVLATYKDKGFERRHFTLVVNKKKAPLFPAEDAAAA